MYYYRTSTVINASSHRFYLSNVHITQALSSFSSPASSSSSSSSSSFFSSLSSSIHTLVLHSNPTRQLNSQLLRCFSSSCFSFQPYLNLTLPTHLRNTRSHLFDHSSNHANTRLYSTFSSSPLLSRDRMNLDVETLTNEPDDIENNNHPHSIPDSLTLKTTTPESKSNMDDLEGLADKVKQRLRDKGITNLFDVQVKVFEPALQGKDIVARSRTGTGKTVAFALPMIHRWYESHLGARKSNAPTMLVMTPTRELARQVATEFQWIEPRLNVATIYGGAAYGPQEAALRKGVDLVVGTPGRVMDMIEKGSLLLDSVTTVVLDEADEMLKIGFKDQMDEIMVRLPTNRQTMLFSATVPLWVRDIAQKQMKEPFVLDLVGSQKLKTSTTVKHIAVRCPPAARVHVLNDVLTVYGGDRCIIFTQTKKMADDICTLSSLRDHSVVLHGDISQASREIALAGFKSGRFRNLVATDVAARGIDIPDVDMVLQVNLPIGDGSTETYIHRSGRTGRAGKDGTSVLFYSEGELRALNRLEKEIGTSFEKLTPPSLKEVLMAASNRAGDIVASTDPDLVHHFLPAARAFYEKFIQEAQNSPSSIAANSASQTNNDPNTITSLQVKTAGLDSTQVVQHYFAAALARLAGYHENVVERSQLSHRENFSVVTISNTNRPHERMTLNYVVSIVRRALDEIDDSPTIGKVITAEGVSAIDLPSHLARALVENKSGLLPPGIHVEMPHKLPTLIVESALAEEDFDTRGGRSNRGPNTGFRSGAYGGRDPNGRGSGRYGSGSGRYGSGSGRYAGGANRYNSGSESYGSGRYDDRAASYGDSNKAFNRNTGRHGGRYGGGEDRRTQQSRRLDFDDDTF